MFPFESTATPVASPRCRSFGILSTLGTESKAMVGTASCARATGTESDNIKPSNARCMGLLLLGGSSDDGRGLLEQVWREGDADGARRVAVQHELDARCGLDRHVGRAPALEDAID